MKEETMRDKLQKTFPQLITIVGSIEMLSEFNQREIALAVAKREEEIIQIVESMRTDWDNKMVNTLDWKDANDWTVDNIISAIKNKPV